MNHDSDASRDVPACARKWPDRVVAACAKGQKVITILLVQDMEDKTTTTMIAIIKMGMWTMTHSFPIIKMGANLRRMAEEECRSKKDVGQGMALLYVCFWNLYVCMFVCIFSVRLKLLQCHCM